MRQYAEIKGVTEKFKRRDAMEYTCRMNSIRNRVEEFVHHDFVYA
ncbi:MAG: TnpV protein [Clostridia bacterium]|nr:TnpV protein [Clostridia bacterium]